MHNIISCQRVFSSNLSFFFSDLNLLFELELDSFRYTFLTNFNLFNDIFKELKKDKHPQKQRPHNLLRNIEFCQKKLSSIRIIMLSITNNLEILFLRKVFYTMINALRIQWQSINNVTHLGRKGDLPKGDITL